LARYEILNALKYSSKFGTQELIRITKDLEGYQFVEVTLDGGYGEVAVRMAVDYGITIYDSSYLAIGRLKDLLVVTADERVLDKVHELDFVHHIREFNRL
jgi:predicted nucleic acid-binding protein